MKLAMLNQLYSFNVLRSNNISEYTLKICVWLFWHVYMVKIARTGPNEIAKDEKKIAFIRKICNCGTFHKKLHGISIYLTSEYAFCTKKIALYSEEFAVRIAFSPYESGLNK